MLSQPPSPILQQDKQDFFSQFIEFSPSKRSPRRKKYSQLNQKSELNMVLSNISKQRLYDNIVTTLHQDPKIQLQYKKLLNSFNQSTLRARNKNKNRDSIKAQQYNIVSLCQTGRSTKSNKMINNRRFSMVKEPIQKRQSVTLPLMKSVTFKDQDINPKDKRIQDLFLKIGKRQSNQFVYDVTFPKKLLLDHISNQFSIKFSTYFNWFMELRPMIDYYYYIAIGNRFMKMDVHKIAHFAYSVLQGFSYQNSLQVFIHDYGSKDLTTIIQTRDIFTAPPPQTFNNFQKKTLTDLQQQKSTPRVPRTIMKSNTLYRRTFQYRQSLGTQQIQKKPIGQKRRRGQISFEQFCSVYSQKVPDIYKVVLRKLYFIQVYDSQKGYSIQRKDQIYNRQRNATKESISPTKSKQKKVRNLNLKFLS